ncbi:MAG TPA: hypothetical protein VGH05_03815 [Buttiauxella sp.]
MKTKNVLRYGFFFWGNARLNIRAWWLVNMPLHMTGRVSVMNRRRTSRLTQQANLPPGNVDGFRWGVLVVTAIRVILRIYAAREWFFDLLCCIDVFFLWHRGAPTFRKAEGGGSFTFYQGSLIRN